MQHLNFEELLNLDLPRTTIQRRIKKYMTNIGYQLTSAQDNPIVYSRGSALGSWTSHNPRKWKTLVNIDITGEDELHQVTISYDVDASGQVILQHERDYWAEEIDTFVFFLEEGKYKLSAINASAQKALHTNHMILLSISLLIGVAVGGLMLFLLSI